MRRTKRRLPRSRDELRQRSKDSGAPLYHDPRLDHAEPHVAAGAPTYVPHPVPVPVPVNTSLCLYAPYECSVYRFPPQWCSMCQVKAASQCAQLGVPDVRMLFQPRVACGSTWYLPTSGCAPILPGTCLPTNACISPTSCPIPAQQCPVPAGPVCPPSNSPTCPLPSPPPSTCSPHIVGQT